MCSQELKNHTKYILCERPLNVNTKPFRHIRQFEYDRDINLNEEEDYFINFLEEDLEEL